MLFDIQTRKPKQGLPRADRQSDLLEYEREMAALAEAFDHPANAAARAEDWQTLRELEMLRGWQQDGQENLSLQEFLAVQGSVSAVTMLDAAPQTAGMESRKR